MNIARFLNPQTLFKPPGYSHVVEVTGPGARSILPGKSARITISRSRAMRAHKWCRPSKI